MSKNLLKQIMMKPADTSHIINTKELIEKINAGYTVHRVPKHTKKNTFAPSTIAYGHGECPRYWYLAFEGNIFEDTATPYSVANMTAGTYSHDRIQQAMLDAKLVVEYVDEHGKPTTEFKVTHSDPPIFGWGDAMIQWGEEQIIGEIKTMPNEAFEYFKGAGKPKKGHLIQLLIYMRVMGKTKGVLIYENKNTHDLVAFPIEINENYVDWVNQTFDWMRTVRKAWEDKTLPQKNYRSNSKICKTCPVKTVCFAAEPGVVKIQSLEGLSEDM